MTDPLDLDPLQDPLQVQKENLTTLRAREAELQEIAARAARIEVESLAADVAVRMRLANGQPRISPEKAAHTVAALKRARALENTEPVQVPDSQQRTLMEVALSALSDWLAAATSTELQGSGAVRTEGIIRVVVLGLVLLVLWVAVSVHFAFLLLVPPIIVPYTLLMRSGDDSKWRRMGAKRHFDRTNLAPPTTWDEDHVRTRHAELTEVVLRTRTPRGACGPKTNYVGTDPGALSQSADTVASSDDPEARTLAAAADLAGLLDEFRISAGPSGHDIAPDIEAWLEKLAAAYLAKCNLDEVHAARGQAERAAGDAREALFRFLVRNGQAPPDGKAETDALATGLTRLLQAGTAGGKPSRA